MSKYFDLGLGINPAYQEFHWGVWIEFPPKGISPRFMVRNNVVARFSKEEAISFAKECSNDPFTKNKYSAREITIAEDFTVF